MNVGGYVTRTLRKFELPIDDLATRDLAKDFLDDVIQENYNFKEWQFRVSRFSFNTSAGVEEYALSKHASSIMMETMRGTDPIRKIRFEPRHEFYGKRLHELDAGDPYWYRLGEMFGYEVNVSAASVITFSSSLTNHTTGTVTLATGSTLVTGASSAFTVDMVGRWFNRDNDEKSYRVAKFISTTRIYIEEPYEGAAGSGLSYTIGDIVQRGIVLGFLPSGAITEEAVELNGSTGVSTVQSFSSLIRISKSHRTHGAITATSNGGLVTNIILDPGELEAEFQTIKMYQIPDREERIEYECYTRHPILYKDSESPLFPIAFQPLIQMDLDIRFKDEYLNQKVSQILLSRRERLFDQLVTLDNSLDSWHVTTEKETQSVNVRGTNLPTNFGPYGEDYDY